MRLVLHIPSDVIQSLLSVSRVRMEKRLLEAFAIEGYQSDLLTQRQVMNLLAFGTREEFWEFLQKNNLAISKTIEDI